MIFKKKNVNSEKFHLLSAMTKLRYDSFNDQECEKGVYFLSFHLSFYGHYISQTICKTQAGSEILSPSECNKAEFPATIIVCSRLLLRPSLVRIFSSAPWSQTLSVYLHSSGSERNFSPVYNKDKITVLCYQFLLFYKRDVEKNEWV